MIRWSLDDTSSNPIVFNAGVADAAGASWWITDTSGWFDSPALRQTVVDKDLTHGSVVASTVMDRRTVHLAGVVRVVGTEDNVWRARDHLMTALATFSGPKTLTVNEYGINKQVTYWSGGAANISIQPGGFEFDITLTIEDPRKFASVVTSGTNITSGANQTLMPFGPYQTPPKFLITGLTPSALTATNILITDTVAGSVIGQIAMNAYTTVSGETMLLIDSMNRTVQGVTNGGNTVNRYGSVNVASLVWFDLQANANNLIAFTGSGYGMVPSYRDAWL